MKVFSSFLVLCALMASTPSYATFPQTLEGVVFTEEGRRAGASLTSYMLGMRETASLSVSIGGPDDFGGNALILNSNRTSNWPPVPALLRDASINANAWLFVKVNEIWYAATWEFMRTGQTVKSTKAVVGANHLIWPPLSGFRPVNGEIYGFMVSGVTRNGIASGQTNIQERSNIAFYRWGAGPVSAQEAVPTAAVVPDAPVAPVVDLILSDPTPM